MNRVIIIVCFCAEVLGLSMNITIILSSCSPTRTLCMNHIMYQFQGLPTSFYCYFTVFVRAQRILITGKKKKNVFVVFCVLTKAVVHNSWNMLAVIATVVCDLCMLVLVSWASPYTRVEEGSGKLCIMSLCCRVSIGQVVQGVTSNFMLIAVNPDIFLAPVKCLAHETMLVPAEELLSYILL